MCLQTDKQRATASEPDKQTNQCYQNITPFCEGSNNKKATVMLMHSCKSVAIRIKVITSYALALP